MLNGFTTAQAPGKIILTGEHFVVLGAPAVAMAVDMYATATARRIESGNIQVEATIPLKALGKASQTQRVNARGMLEPLRLAARETLDYIGEGNSGISLDVDCEIPVGAGLGSSASTTVAIMFAVATAKQASLTRKELFKLGFGPESFVHGHPSGVDHATSIYGGLIRFSKPDRVEQFKLKRLPLILVCDSGIHRSTRKLVGSVVRKSARKRQVFADHVDQVRTISEGALRALRKGDVRDLGWLMDINHELLARIGVSHPKLDKLVHVARANGALGAKLTGAGGGGCIIVLCETRQNESTIAGALRRNGGVLYRVSLDSEGAKPVPAGTVLKWATGNRRRKPGVCWRPRLSG